MSFSATILSRYQSRRKGRELDPTTWHKTLSNATNLPIELVLKPLGTQVTKEDLQNMITYMLNSIDNTGKQPQDSTPKSNQSMPEAGGDQTHTAEEAVHSSSRLAETPAALYGNMLPDLAILKHYSQGDGDQLTKLADTLHQVLLTHHNALIRHPYTQSKRSSRSELLYAIREMKAVFADSATSQKERMMLQLKIRIAVLALSICDFFWPSDFDHEMIQAFYSAVRSLVDNSSFLRSAHEDGSEDILTLETAAFQGQLETLLRSCSAFTKIFRHNEHHLTSISKAFFDAWLHTITAFIIAADFEPARKSASLPAEQLASARAQLGRGEKALFARIRKGSIEDYEVCPPTGIAALIFDRLSRDLVKEGCPDVIGIYTAYCQRLESMILEKPTVRSHQDALRNLQQELEAILQTLKKQLDVLATFETSLEVQDEGKPTTIHLETMDQPRREYVIRRCIRRIESRMDQVQALQQRGRDLGEWHLGQIETNKDQQEVAIFAFTIVTVIFLPLSSVAGIFGMNVADIRDMEQGQWVFWVIATPLTLLVVGGTLHAAGLLQGLWTQQSTRASSLPGDGRSAKYEMDHFPRATKSEKVMSGTRAHKSLRRRTTYPDRRELRRSVQFDSSDDVEDV